MPFPIMQIGSAEIPWHKKPRGIRDVQLGHHDSGSAIDRLASLLDEEAVGRPIDPDEVIRLAQEVSRIVPEITPFMHRVIHRMKAKQSRIRAA
ncbi:hypothetical protein A6A04_08785 [Paramagnetospirillum marisnigri]|uniref:Uncharacterized protein n=1 Tax=Paramagnetospirillum marisnigri TaxID=1285242 RepID=A0A178M7E0_9PROT|nr:hypothetical protein [Paramagnetospirillum marisnigri]OAN43968.1 hypothetical protein A6A04_08785 [Paramagnetospirillum marisnigri]